MLTLLSIASFLITTLFSPLYIDPAAFGCNAPIMYENESIAGSYFDGEALHIGTIIPEGLPAPHIIVLHEIGHCVQAANGLTRLSYKLNPSKYELDADRLAVEFACQLGRDGWRDNYDILMFIHDEFGYEGDPEHGSLAARIHAGDNAPSCQRIPQAA